MAYIEGFIVPVPAANKEAYREMAAKAVPLFREFGATRLAENWGDDVPKGEVNDFRTAVKAEEGEEVCFSWIEYPDKTVRDAANQKMMSDPRMQEMGDMPFDGMRMIFAGFAPFIDQKNGAAGHYVDGYLLAVPNDKMDAYEAMAEKAAAIFKEYGATRVVEAWGEDVPDGKVTDFKGAVHAKEDETIVYSWVEWPSKDVRNAAWPKIMEDERMKPDHDNMPFDGKRMIYGGFTPILDA